MWSPCCPRDPEGSSSLGKHLLKPLSVFVLDFWFILTSETSLSILNTSPLSDVLCTRLTPVCGLTSGFLCTVWAERKSWVVGGMSSLCTASPVSAPQVSGSTSPARRTLSPGQGTGAQTSPGSERKSPQTEEQSTPLRVLEPRSSGLF